ncbi:uncharacterized protein LOC134662804 [Cydia amplana]|uniref:uncharacterized protein LOC134662804 n=1 Tax=Cydia amplana TaxID=1869771 RepID=UPI002FE554A4
MTETTKNVILANNLKPLVLNLQNGGGKSECANSEVWRKWKQRFEIFSDANDLDKLPERKKIAILLNAIGDEGLEIFNSFNVNLADETIENLLKKFDSKFNACKNTTVERYNFFTRYQNEETLDQYVTSLNNLAATCDFGTLKDSLVKDMFIIGLKNEIIKEKLLQNQELQDVSEAVNIAKTIELSNKRSKKLSERQESSNQVEAITKHTSRPKFRNSSSRTPSKSRYNRHSSQGRSTTSYSREASQSRNSGTCQRCGQVHRHKCPAQGKTCAHCKKPNHFAQYCFLKNKKDNI